MPRSEGRPVARTSGRSDGKDRPIRNSGERNTAGRKNAFFPSPPGRGSVLFSLGRERKPGLILPWPGERPPVRPNWAPSCSCLAPRGKPCPSFPLVRQGDLPSPSSGEAAKAWHPPVFHPFLQVFLWHFSRICRNGRLQKKPGFQNLTECVSISLDGIKTLVTRYLMSSAENVAF